MATVDTAAAVTASQDQLVGQDTKRGFKEFARRNPTVIISGSVLLFMVFVAIFAPFLANDPMELEPWNRLKPPSGDYWFGTDHLGRDAFARTVYGTRISLSVGLIVALASSGFGLIIGLLAGYIRIVDTIVMRVMCAIRDLFAAHNGQFIIRCVERQAEIHIHSANRFKNNCI